MDKPLISLIVPCYNVEKLCDRFFQSLLEQTYSHIQLILVNDGSTDGTEQKLFSYKDALEGKGYIFEYIYQENRGLGGAINTGLKRVKGEYLCWADPDDYYEKNAFEVRLQYFQENPECMALTADAYVRHSENMQEYSLMGERYSRDKRQFELLLDGRSIFCSGCHMVRVEAFRRANPEMDIYEERRGQNWQLLLPAYYLFERHFLDVPVYNYIVYKNSMSNSNNDPMGRFIRYQQHEKILNETLKRIEKLHGGDFRKYYAFVSDKYAKLRMECALELKDDELFDRTYAEKQKSVGLDSIDKKLLFRRKHKTYNALFVKLRNKIRGGGEDSWRLLDKLKNTACLYSLPLVSVIIPCYNGKDFLETCFACLLLQSYKNLQVIIVDDGSQDGSINIISKYKSIFEKQGKEYIHIRQENQGAAAAVNNALRYVTGKYIMLYDVDDVLYRDAVYKKVEHLERNRDMQMVINNGYYVSNVGKLGENLFYRGKRYKEFFNGFLMGRIYNWPGAYMCRAKVFFDKLKGRNIYISKYGQNLQFVLPMAYDEKVGFLFTPLMDYYVRPGSHSHCATMELLLERSYGYEGNYLNVLKMIAMPNEERENYTRIIHQKATIGRIQYGIQFRNKHLFQEELNNLAYGKLKYKLKWFFRRVRLDFISRAFSWGIRKMRNYRASNFLMRENDKHY